MMLVLKYDKKERLSNLLEGSERETSLNEIEWIRNNTVEILARITAVENKSDMRFYNDSCKQNSTTTISVILQCGSNPLQAMLTTYRPPFRCHWQIV